MVLFQPIACVIHSSFSCYDFAMNLRENPESLASLKFLKQCGLLTDTEEHAFVQLFEPATPLASAICLAETLHLHIKVEDTNQLPFESFLNSGAILDHQKDGFVKFRFPGAINAISHTSKCLRMNSRKLYATGESALFWTTSALT